MFFPGGANSKKTSIRGKSKAEPTREEILERTRLERDARKRQKLEVKSSVTIQAAVRGWRSRRRTLADLQAEWDRRYSAGAALPDEVTSTWLDSHFLQSLLFFSRMEHVRDVERLAAAARVVVLALRGRSLSAASFGNAEGGIAQQRLLRVKKLAWLCLSALNWHRDTFQIALSSPRPAAGTASGPSVSPAVHLIDAVLALVDSKSYSATVSPACTATAAPSTTATAGGTGGTPAAVASAVVQYLAKNEATEALRNILSIAMAASTGGTTSGTAGGTLPYAETLSTQLMARILALKDWEPSFYRQGVHRLLLVPLLLTKCPSLQPIAARLLRRSVTELAGHLASGAGGSLIRVLPSEAGGPLGGRAGAVAVLLGNLLQSGTKAVQAWAAAPASDPEVASRGATAMLRDNAVRLVRVLQACLSLLPLAPFFGATTSAAAASAAASSSAAAQHLERDDGSETVDESRLEMGCDEMVPAELVAQVQSVGGPLGRLLVRELVAAVLPLTTQASTSTSSPASPAATSADPTAPIRAAYDLCRLLHTLMALPGQAGQSVPLVLAVSTDFVPRLWASMLRPCRSSQDPAVWPVAPLPSGAPWYMMSGRTADGKTANSKTAANGEGDAVGRRHSTQQYDPCADDPGWLLPLVVCCSAFSSHIMTADLDEFYKRQQPLPLVELYNPSRPSAGFLALLKDCLWQVLWLEVHVLNEDTRPAAVLREEFASLAGRLYGQLYDRNCRTAFCPTEAFIQNSLPREQFSQEASSCRAAAGKLDGSGRIWRVLRHAPSLVPFEERARVFTHEVSDDRAEYREMEHRQRAEAAATDMDLAMHIHQQRFISVRRNQVLFDGFDRLNPLNEALRGRVRVQFTNEHGAPEAGVDGGGLFKEFMEQLLKEGFNTQYGLFSVNASNQLYPNPAAFSVVEDAPRLLEFLGRMLGKAMYEGILVELPLAGFFLKKFRGGLCDINDLPTLDPEVYRNLTMLRHYEGDVSELSLTFTAADSHFGSTVEVELRPDGRNIAVGNDNVVEYIHRVADYRLNRQLQRPVNAFLHGFFSIIRKDWVVMFNEEELQKMINGADAGTLDLEDMKEHIEYAGGYHDEHPVMLCFWETLASFDPDQQRKFLKFVTACSRPPLLGFKYLEPHLCIQMAGSMLDDAPDRLPTSATCMNLLKLPPYRTTDVMRSKLLYAIESGAGFDLS